MPFTFNRSNSGVTKVMNAPREYYPVGYDKNFDDNFASRVDLPDTSFYCGDQKHFPGLYADQDLGCMVKAFNIYLNIAIKLEKNMRNFYKGLSRGILIVLGRVLTLIFSQLGIPCLRIDG